MPIDASIYNLANKPTVELNTPAQTIQLRSLMNQGQLQNMQIQQQRQAMGDSQAVRDAFQNGVGPDGSVDRQKVLQSLSQGGHGQAAMQLGQEWAVQDQKNALAKLEVQKSIAGMNKDQLAGVSQLNEMMGQKAQAIKALPPERQAQAWDQAAGEMGQTAQKMGMNDVFTPLVGKYSPQSVDFAINHAMTVKDALDLQNKQADRNFRGQEFDETKRHNVAMERKPTMATIQFSQGGAGGMIAPTGAQGTPLDQVPANVRDLVKAVGEYRMMPSNLGNRDRSVVMSYVAKAYPNFSQGDAQAARTTMDPINQPHERFLQIRRIIISLFTSRQRAISGDSTT